MARPDLTVGYLAGDELADFLVICPGVKKVTCRFSSFDTVFGVGVEFEDGKRCAFIFDGRGAEADRRPYTLTTAADRAFRWYEGQNK